MPVNEKKMKDEHLRDAVGNVVGEAMREYEERVERLARERSGEPVYNGSIDHAAVIVENMFQQAHSYVHILTGNLNPRVYGPSETLEAAELFLSEGEHMVKIILETDDLEDLNDHPFFKRLSAFENLEVRQMPPEDQANYDFHFAVMDQDSYRFEEDKKKHSAVAAFGDRDGGENLTEVFEQLWGWATKVDKPAT